MATKQEEVFESDDVRELVGRFRHNQVVLTGGCFQNAILSELVTNRLTENGFLVLSHSQIPTNDGGLALGQAAVAAGHHLKS